MLKLLFLTSWFFHRFFPDALDLRLPTNGDINPHHRYLLVQPPQLSSRPFPFTDSSTAAVPTKQHSPTLSIEQRLADLTNARRHPGIPVPASTAGSPLPGRPSSADVPSSGCRWRWPSRSCTPIRPVRGWGPRWPRWPSGMSAQPRRPVTGSKERFQAMIFLHPRQMVSFELYGNNLILTLSLPTYLLHR